MLRLESRDAHASFAEQCFADLSTLDRGQVIPARYIERAVRQRQRFIELVEGQRRVGGQERHRLQALPCVLTARAQCLDEAVICALSIASMQREHAVHRVRIGDHVVGVASVAMDGQNLTQAACRALRRLDPAAAQLCAHEAVAARDPPSTNHHRRRLAG